MDNPVFPSTVTEHSIPIPPIGIQESHAASAADSSSLVTRGVGRCLGKYFPHLLKNNFNKVLLVDDDPAIHVGISQVLTTSGYVVQHAISEIDAVQIIKDSPPDFLIINWKKSTSNCLQFYESLRRGFIDKYLYIIVMTTEGLVRDKVQMIAAGADVFLVKPVAAGELLSLLQAGTRIIEQQLHLKELAMHDPLTGLLNRRTLSELQKREWSRAERRNETISCAMIDVDYFKNINDVYGHIHGDRVLARIGELLIRIGRKSDILCRYGGDEFCMFMPDTDLQGALICAERFWSAVAAEKRFFAESVSFPTVTIGVATKTAEMKDTEEIFEKADQALRWAKLNSRNSVAAYDVSQAAMAAFRANAR
jgi:diguanylate cyclase (GGDEF)-like protein